MLSITKRFFRKILQKIGYQLNSTSLQKISELEKNSELAIRNTDRIENKLNTLEDDICNLENRIGDCYRRIEITENNLNYYNMIRNIQNQNPYTNFELLNCRFSNGKKVLIVGFYGAYNLGDELMLQTLLDKLSAIKGLDITVMLCNNENYNYSWLPAVNIIHYPRTVWDYNTLANKFDCLIWGGGAIIDDSNYGFENISDLGSIFIELSSRFIKFSKSCIALGLSSNHVIQNELYINKLRNIIEKSAHFSVRDFYSKKTLESIGATPQKINVIYDLVFANDIWKKDAEKPNKSKVTIGIVFVALNKQKEKLQKMLDSVFQVCSELYGKNFEIHCIPFYNHNNNDTEFYKSISNGDNIIICDYKNDISEIFKEFSSLDIVISMRYHATVISAILKIPTILICMNEHPHYYNKLMSITDITDNKESLIDFNAITSERFADILKFKLQNKKQTIFDRTILQNSDNRIKNILNTFLGE